jgi:hypothetical protein
MMDLFFTQDLGQDQLQKLTAEGRGGVAEDAEEVKSISTLDFQAKDESFPCPAIKNSIQTLAILSLKFVLACLKN